MLPFSDLHCLHSPETLNWIKKSNPCSLDLYPCRLEIGLRSPKWLRDEILLVAEIGIRLVWPATGPKEEISRVSNLLARGVVYGDEFQPGSKFRNVNGVSRKYFDLYSARPSYEGQTTNGGKATREIAALAESNPQLVVRLAEDIRRMLAEGKYERKNLSFLSCD